VPPSQSFRNLRFSALGLSNFRHERHFLKSPVAKLRVVGEPIAESQVVGEPIVASKIVLLHFSPQNVRVHFGITSSGRTYPESRVVGEPIVACGNGFQVPSLYRWKQFSVSGKFGRERRKRFSVSERSFENIVAGGSSQKNPSSSNPKSSS
jgi:hypothetical protein